jgi:hypothetical protein
MCSVIGGHDDGECLGALLLPSEMPLVDQLHYVEHVVIPLFVRNDIASIRTKRCAWITRMACLGIRSNVPLTSHIHGSGVKHRYPTVYAIARAFRKECCRRIVMGDQRYLLVSLRMAGDAIGYGYGLFGEPLIKPLRMRRTLLHLAAERQWIFGVRDLLKLFPESARVRDAMGRTALHASLGAYDISRSHNGLLRKIVLRRDVDELSIYALVEGGCDVSARDEYGCTILDILMCSANFPCTPMRMHLIDVIACASPSVECLGMTLLNMASACGHSDGFDMATFVHVCGDRLDASATWGAMNDTAMHIIARSATTGTSRTVQRAIDALLGRGASVKTINALGRTPLHDVSDPDVAMWLVERGACPMTRDARGKTILHVACTMPHRKNSWTLVEKLVAAFPGLINCVDDTGSTALSYMIRSKYPASVIEDTVRAGADTTIVDGAGRSMADIVRASASVADDDARDELMHIVCNMRSDDESDAIRGLMALNGSFAM